MPSSSVTGLADLDEKEIENSQANYVTLIGRVIQVVKYFFDLRKWSQKKTKG
jgi:hypothetical protein